MPALRKSGKEQVYKEDSEESDISDPLQSDDDGDGADDEAPEVSLQPKAVAQAKRKPGKRARLDIDVAELSLLEICRDHGSAIRSAAKEWVGQYKEDSTSALARLLTFLVHASGSRRQVTDEDVEAGEVDKLVSQLVKEVSQEGFVDLFKGNRSKAFKAHYLKMWDEVLGECHEQEVLLDDALLDKLVNLLIGLSCSVMRCFRAIGTLTSCQVATSVIRVMLTLSEARDTAQRQFAAEERKKSGKAGQERMAAFKRTADRCHHQINSLQAYVNTIFQGVAAHRFRDVCEEIRAAVIKGVGSWIHLYPAMFLKDVYLKYLAWALSDKDALVREAAVDALLALYSQEENISALHGFTERFKGRFAELTNDVSDAVAVKGVQLLTVLLKSEELPHSQVTDAYLLLIESSHSLRHAAAELVVQLLEDTGRQFFQEQAAVAGKGRRKSLDSYTEKDLQLGGLLRILSLLRTTMEEQVEAAERGAVSTALVGQVVDALYERVEVLSDWKALTAALLDDKACERRGDASTTDLVLLLRDAVHMASGGNLVASRATHRKQLGKGNAAAAVKEQRQEVTLALSKVLLKLLRKFQADNVKSAALVAIVRDLKLEIFSLKRDEAGLEEILVLVASLATKHALPDTISQCLRTLVHCASSGPDSLQETGRRVLQECVEGLCSTFVEASKELLAVPDEELLAETEASQAEPAEVFACRVALLRLHHLLLVAPLEAEDSHVPATLQELLQAASLARPIPESVTSLATQAQLLLFAWQLHAMEEDEGKNVPTAKDLERDLRRFSNQLENLLQGDSWDVRNAVFFVLCDLLLLFCPAKLQGTTAAAAGLEAPRELAMKMGHLLEEFLAREPAGSETMQDEDDEVAQDAVDSASQAKAVAALGRLVIYQVEPFPGSLAGQLLSHLASHNEDVAAAVKDVVRQLKKTRAAQMPQIYLAALCSAFERLTDEEDGQEQLVELSQRIASAYAGFVSNAADAVGKIVRGGIKYAFQDVNVKERLPFLQCLAVLAPRLAVNDSSAVASLLEEAARSHKPSDSDAAWESFFTLRDALQDRAAKGKTPRSALKKGSSIKKAPGRKISFKEAGRRRMAHEYDEDSDDEEDGNNDNEQAGGPEHEEDAVEESQEEEEEPLPPPPRHVPKARQAVPLRRISLARAPSEPSKSPGSLAENDDDIMEDVDQEEGEEPVLPSEEQLHLRRSREPIDYSDAVLPSEEQLHISHTPLSGSRRSRRSSQKQRSGMDDEDDEDDDEEEEEEAPVGRFRPRHY